MDWMHLLFAAAATGAAGLAWGYRGQGEREKEQVAYLRRQLGDAPAPQAGEARQSRALTPIQGQRNG